MARETLRYGPVVVVSRDGRRGLELSRYEGTEKIANRDAHGFYFAVRTNPAGPSGRIRVIYDGLSMMLLKPGDYGLPEVGGREQALVHFSEAAIGDFLDGDEQLDLPSDGTAATIECFSACQERWKARTAADEDAIEAYIRARLLWSWRFGRENGLFTSPDYLRLGVDQSRFLRIAELGEPELWTIGWRNPFSITLLPTKPLLSEEKVRRQAHEKAPEPQSQRTYPLFVDEGRLQELRGITDPRYDLRRLIALCEELNACSASNCLHAMAMLTRAIVDHVPPIFGAKNFNEVASNYGGAKSFKESMEHLSKSARKIGDAHLHVQVRSKEVLPTRTQVDFSRDLDVLLSEIVRILK